MKPGSGDLEPTEKKNKRTGCGERIFGCFGGGLVGTLLGGGLLAVSGFRFSLLSSVSILLLAFCVTTFWALLRPRYFVNWSIFLCIALNHELDADGMPWKVFITAVLGMIGLFVDVVGLLIRSPATYFVGLLLVIPFAIVNVLETNRQHRNS